MPTLRMAPTLTIHAESDAGENDTKMTIQMKASSMSRARMGLISIPMSRPMVSGNTSASEAIHSGKLTQ